MPPTRSVMPVRFRQKTRQHQISFSPTKSSLTGTFFDVRQQWTPSPKQRLAVIRDMSPDLYVLLCAFYQHTEPQEKIDVAERMLPLVFPTK